MTLNSRLHEIVLKCVGQFSDMLTFENLDDEAKLLALYLDRFWTSIQHDINQAFPGQDLHTVLASMLDASHIELSPQDSREIFHMLLLNQLNILLK